jgi:tetratricopeptide (TPR) repeat protein
MTTSTADDIPTTSGPIFEDITGFDYEPWKEVDLDKISQLKEEGNTFFKKGNYEEAEKRYRTALFLCTPKKPEITQTTKEELNTEQEQSEEEEKNPVKTHDATILYEDDDDKNIKDIPPEYREMQTVLYSNLAACYLQLKAYERCITEATHAINRDPKHLKSLLRRAQANEELERYEQAVTDLKVVLEVNPSSQRVRKDVERVEKLRQEQQKAEMDKMLGQLKDLGNSILGKFGLSLDQFKFEKDPTTGSYSVSMGNGTKK